MCVFCVIVCGCVFLLYMEFIIYAKHLRVSAQIVLYVRNICIEIVWEKNGRENHCRFSPNRREFDFSMVARASAKDSKAISRSHKLTTDNKRSEWLLDIEFAKDKTRNNKFLNLI